MLFKSNGKFIDNVTDSFNRFGLQTKLSEKGSSKNTQKFEMYDSIHDSAYVAVAVEKPVGKMAAKEWNNIIENDLLPTLVNENNVSSFPASALIVPSKDIDVVEKMLIDKGFSPSIYQLFPGYVVAGINKKDTAKLIKDYMAKKDAEKVQEKKEEIKEEVKNEDIPLKKEPVKKEESKKEDNKIDIEKKKADTLNSLSNIENKKPNKVENKKKAELDNTPNIKPRTNSSLAKKLAAAALLGTAIGAGAVAAPEIKSQINDYLTPKEEKIEKEVLEKAAEKYFAAVAQNPNTPEDVLEKLYKDKSNNVLKALAKNPSITPDMMDNLSNYTGLHSHMMENPALTPELMRKITAGKNRDCEFNKKYMSNPCISTEELLYNLNNPDECVREGIALNPNAPAEAIEKLSQDNNPIVKNAAFKHKNMAVEKLNSLFPENWVPEYNDTVKEAERVAALENPNISPEIRKKAVFMDSKKYGKAVAANKSVSPELINRMKNMAQGKKGVNMLLYKAKNIKNDPKQLSNIKEQMDKNNETIDKPVRRLMNKQFVENVYDPYELIEDMRRLPSKNKKFNLKKDSKDGMTTNNSANGGVNNGRNGAVENITPQTDTPSSILDKNGNAPDRFAAMPLPPLEKGAVSYNPDAEKQALKTADDIIDSIMSDSLPDIEKSIQSGNYIKNNGTTSNNAGGNNNGGLGGGGLSSYGKSINPNAISENDKKIYEKACRKIDQLHKMF